MALAIENGRLEVELRARLEALRASRARIVEAGDAERRRLTRDLHDGAQQRLVSLKIDLQLARERVEEPAAPASCSTGRSPTRTRPSRSCASWRPASTRRCSPQRGLDAAVETLATRAPLPVEFETRLGARLPSAVETAAYFVVAEALTNVAKYAGASHARVDVRDAGEELVVEVRDDGRARGAERVTSGGQWAARARRPRGRARRHARGREPGRRGHAGARPDPAALSGAGRRGRLAPAGGRSAASGRSSLEKIAVTCFSTAALVTTSTSAIPRLVRPSAISSSTWRSRGVSASSGSSRRRRPIMCETTVGIEHDAAGGDAADRLGERARSRRRGP